MKVSLEFQKYIWLDKTLKIKEIKISINKHKINQITSEVLRIYQIEH